MPRPYAVALVALVCLFTAGFGVTWGPLKWIIPSDIYQLEVRSAGQGMSKAISLALTSVQTQSFLNMLCSFKYGAFAYNAGWVVLMTAFVAFFLPETKGVPIESLREVWARHWYWKTALAVLAQLELEEAGELVDAADPGRGLGVGVVEGWGSNSHRRGWKLDQNMGNGKGEIGK